MITNMFKVLLKVAFVLAVIFIAVPVFAQDGGEPGLPGGILGQILMWVLSASGITVIAQFLKGFTINLPSFVRPLIGPLLGILAGIISQQFGLVVDFGPIEGALLGTTAAALFDTGKATGVLKGTGS